MKCLRNPNPDEMKKIIPLLGLLSVLLFSCDKKDPEPQEEEIRAYCSLFNFLSDPNDVSWTIDEVEFSEDHPYGNVITGAVLLADSTEEISFIAESTSGTLLGSQLLEMEENKHYIGIIHGTREEPILEFQQVETAKPASSSMKFLFLHSAPMADSVDVYMGGTETEKRVIEDLDYKQYSGYFEVSEFDVRASVIVSLHSPLYEEDKEVLRYEYNDLLVVGGNYFCVVAPVSSDPEDSEIQLWLYDLPVEY